MKRMNIAVFFDGTGQNRSLLPKEKWSNVAILHDAIDEEPQEDVVQYRKYIDGVGTRQGEDLSGGGWGIGLDERIEEAYEFLWEKVNNAIFTNFLTHISKKARVFSLFGAPNTCSGVPISSITPFAM